MEWEKVKVGTIVNIKNKKFEVVKKYSDVFYDHKEKRVIDILVCELHQIGSKRIVPDHILEYYPETGEMFLTKKEWKEKEFYYILQKYLGKKRHGFVDSMREKITAEDISIRGKHGRGF